VDTTEALLRQIADRSAIMEAKAAYCRYADCLDIEGMLSVFTADCEFRFGPGDDVIVGIDAIRDWYHLEVDRTVASLHIVSNFEVDFDAPDRARSRCALHSWKRFREAADDRHRYVHYVDEWVRTGTDWKQSRLEYLVIGETGTATPRGREHLGADRAA
jgi:hypothetical protein